MPTVVIVHEALANSARAMARVSGMPDYAFLTVSYPHIPLAVWTEEEIRSVAKELAPQIVELLTARV